MKIHFIGTPIKRWGYEQAFASGVIVTVQRNDPEMEELERHLNEQFKRTPDNKTTFEMCTRDDIYYITFHDYTVHVGTNVRPYRGDTLVAPEVRTP